MIIVGIYHVWDFAKVFDFCLFKQIYATLFEFYLLFSCSKDELNKLNELNEVSPLTREYFP